MHGGDEQAIAVDARSAEHVAMPKFTKLTEKVKDGCDPGVKPLPSC
jgi:hypothetical protein